MYGPVCTVVWQGSAGDRRPYADQTALWEGYPAGSSHGGYLSRNPHLAKNLPGSSLLTPVTDRATRPGTCTA